MNKKIYQIGFFLMLAVNVLLIVLLSNKAPHKNPSDLKEIISTKLNLSESQRRIYYGLASEHREKMRTLSENEKKIIEDFFQNLSNNNVNNNSHLLKSISAIHEQKVSITYQHFEDLRNICNTEQLTDFDKIMADILKVLLGENNQPPPPPERR